MKTNLGYRCLGLLILLSCCVVAVAQGGAQQARGNPPRPQLRVIDGKLGEWVGVGSFRYRATSTASGLRDYRQQYNQGGKRLHPGFPSDRLAVVQLEVLNMSPRAVEPPIFMAALIDSDGVRGTDWLLDVRQQAFLEESSRGGRASSRIPAMIASNQTMKMAVVFSISAKAKPVSLEFSPENFRDMRFGDAGRYQRGGAVPTPAQGQIGPRGGGQNRQGPPRDAIRVSIDLVHTK